MRKRRLKGASKYVLRTQAAMAFQRAETLYFRHFRLWLNKRFDGELRLKFGWTAKKYVSELVHQRVIKGKLGENPDVKAETRKVMGFIQRVWFDGDIHDAYREARVYYNEAMEAIDSGKTQTLSGETLQTLIYAAGELVPYINPGKCR